jgi:hypothetical protein
VHETERVVVAQCSDGKVTAPEHPRQPECEAAALDEWIRRRRRAEERAKVGDADRGHRARENGRQAVGWIKGPNGEILLEIGVAAVELKIGVPTHMEAGNQLGVDGHQLDAARKAANGLAKRDRDPRQVLGICWERVNQWTNAHEELSRDLQNGRIFVKFHYVRLSD